MKIEYDWTPERISALNYAWARKKMSARQIAKMLGTTRNAVIGKVSRLRKAGVWQDAPTDSVAFDKVAE